MAATVVVKEQTGPSGGPTTTTITNTRYKSADDATQDTNDPLVKPSAGTNYSFEKWHFINADTTPSGTINNVKWFTDGTLGWTGITLYDGTQTAYVTPVGTNSSIATTDATTHDSGSPLSVSGSLDNPSTGLIADFVITQADLSTSAVAGALSSETLTWRYDET